MFLQARKYIPSRAFAAYNAITDVKRVAVGKRANEGDHVGVGGESATVQSQVADSRAKGGDDVSNLYHLTGLGLVKGKSGKPRRVNVWRWAKTSRMVSCSL